MIYVKEENMFKKRVLIFLFLFLLFPTLSFAVKELDADRDGKIDSDLLPIDTTATLGSSDTVVPSQNAVKTYSDTKAPINNPTFTGIVKGVISGTTDNCVKIGADGTIVDNGSACGGTMVYPSAGIAVSSGSAWSTTATSSTIIDLFSGTGDYLKTDGTKGTPTGVGDFVGPASSINNNFIKFGDISGKLGADSGYSATSFMLSSLATDKGVFTASGSATPTFTALGATTDGVFGVSSSTLGFYTTMQLDDSAPQFKHADDTQTFKIDLQYLTTGDTPSIAPIGNYEFKYTLTAPTNITVPTSGTLQTVKTEKLAVFNIPGDSADNTVVDAYVPVASTITGVLITTTGAACSAVVDIWSDTYANFPATVTDTITASAKPTLSTAQKNKDTTLTGWTTAIAADSVLRANLDSSDCAGLIQVTILGTK